MINGAHVFQELLNVVGNYPVWPGDTLSHATAAECARRGYIVRQKDGCWIPTAFGLSVWNTINLVKALNHDNDN